VALRAVWLTGCGFNVWSERLHVGLRWWSGQHAPDGSWAGSPSGSMP